MQKSKLSDMVGGWFVGSFTPTAHTTSGAEVAVKTYRAGDYEPNHVHRIATEITLILSGKARMGTEDLSQGDILTLAPGEATDFTALTDVTTVVVKTPSVPGDKYSTTDR